MIFTLALTCGVACGSGGGGGGASEPAQVIITVSPEILDSGERTTVKVSLFDFSEEQVAIKVRYPAALDYVTESSTYVIEGQDVDAGPDVEDSDETHDYLVFYFDTETLEGSDRLELFFKLRAAADVTPDDIEVDIDLDDPDIKNSEEFAVATPLFDAQDEAFIQVGETSSSSSSSSSG